MTASARMATPASVGLRPVLIVGATATSLLGSSLVGTGNGFGSTWLVINAGLQLSIAGWLLIRPGGATAGALSAGVLSAFVLVIYGSWAPALAAGEPFSPVVPGLVEKSALEYTTAAALVVTCGVILVSSVYAMGRGQGSRVNHRSAVPPSRWWRGVLFMETFGLCCFVALKVTSHQPVFSFALFRPLPTDTAQTTTSGIYQFLSAGIDVSIGAAIAASGLLGLKAYRLRVLALIVLNLFLYTTIGFKYRIVVTLIGVFGVWAATHPHKGKRALRSQRIKVVLVGVAVTAVAFFVVQVYRANHEFILGGKPLPAMLLRIRAVTIPGTGAAVPFWAEADANFGLIGLLGFGAILGWIVSRSDTADRRRIETATIAAATGAVLASVLSRSLMFFALYEFAAIVYPICMLSRSRPVRGTAGSSEPQAGVR